MTKSRKSIMSLHAECLPKLRLPITQRALNKAETTARLVAELYGSPVESMGFLVTDQGERGPDRVVTDILLGHDQSIGSASVEISPSGVLASGREIARKKMFTIGWTHAHPFETFHSGTDVENMGVVLHDLAAGNAWPLREPGAATVCWEGTGLVIRTEVETIRITGTALAALRSPTESGEENCREGAPDLHAEVQSSALMAAAAYSLVVSATGRKPYAEMATRLECAICGHVEEQTQQVPIEIVDTDALDIDALKSEIRRKVNNLPMSEPAVPDAKSRLVECIGNFVKRCTSALGQPVCDEVGEG